MSRDLIKYPITDEEIMEALNYSIDQMKAGVEVMKNYMNTISSRDELTEGEIKHAYDHIVVPGDMRVAALIELRRRLSGAFRTERPTDPDPQAAGPNR